MRVTAAMAIAPENVKSVINTPADYPCECQLVGFSCYPVDPKPTPVPPKPEPSRCNCCYAGPRKCKVCNTPADYPCQCRPVGFSCQP